VKNPLCSQAPPPIGVDPEQLSTDNEEVPRLSLEEVQKFLAEETFFRGVSEAAIASLSGIATQRVVPKDSMLFSMGQSCEALHFVAAGCALIVKTAPDGRQRILHRVTCGEMVGAVPFFDRKPYPASFTAESECVVLSFPRDRLLELLGVNPAFSLSIIGGLVERLRMMTSLVERMSFEDTAHRLWHYLLEASKGSGDGYPRTLESLPTREHIASTIGTVREVVSRRLSSLVDSGHVKIEGRRLVLLRSLEKDGQE